MKIKNSIKKIIKTLSHEKDKEEKPSIKMNIVGVYSTIPDIIYNLCEFIINCNDQGYKEDMFIKECIDILVYNNIIPIQFKGNLFNITSSAEEFKFSFVEKDSDYYCVIYKELPRHDYDVLGIFKVSEDKIQYDVLNTVLNDPNCYIENTLSCCVFSIICGIVLQYVRTSVSRFVIQNHDYTYLINVYPKKCKIVRIKEWINLDII